VPSDPLLAAPPLRSALAAFVLGWAWPGLGHLAVGRPGRAVVMCVVILGLYSAGLWLSAWSCIDPDEYGLEFVAHAMIGGPTAIVLRATQDLALREPAPWLEVGRLYCAVGGLLNLVAALDAAGVVLDWREARAEAVAAARPEPAPEAFPEPALEAPVADTDLETPPLPWPEPVAGRADEEPAP
jgi:hypothetical protein